MKIPLPSNGVFGLKFVEMRQPVMSDLRKVEQFSSDEVLAKNEFLRLLLNDPTVLPSISTYDRDYLFTIAVGAINLNKIPYVVTCSHCGKKHTAEYDITVQEPVFLEEDVQRELLKVVGSEELVFQALSVAQEEAIVAYALEDEDEQHYASRVEDAKVCTILGYAITPENIERVTKMDLSLYYAAMFFQVCMRHGLSNVDKCTCSQCDQDILVSVPVIPLLLQSNTALVMSKFAALAGKVSFEAFNELTIPEYQSLVNSLGTK